MFHSLYCILLFAGAMSVNVHLRFLLMTGAVKLSGDTSNQVATRVASGIER